MNVSGEMEKDNKECFTFVRKDVSISGCLVSYGTNNNQEKIQQFDLEKDQNKYYSTYELNWKCQPNATDDNSQMNGSLGYDSSCSSSSPELAVSPKPPVILRSRSNFSRHQVDILENSYDLNPQPSRYERYLLSRKVGLTENQVKYWFQNRRTRIRKKEQRLKVNVDVLVQEINILKELTEEEVVDVIGNIDRDKGKGK